MTEPRSTTSNPSFDDWVGARAAGLLRFAYLVTGSQHAAEDAVQSALERACRKWARISRVEDPDAYVRRMIVNEHVSGWRRAGRKESPVAEVRVTDPADPADEVSRADAVWRVCEGLPPQQRAAVVLRYYEDLEYAEIAAVLGVAEPTARSHVHRALTALRGELERQEHSDG
ncbi:MAG TPA: SigE family RNA polymerase sigma factor [Nocardioides sp.]|nr:SigE family RNA polymerase sigma factor [Nocardioides sp.]